jgi:hypothetical protein
LHGFEKEVISKPKKPAKDLTHTIVGEVGYFRKEPRQGDKPDGYFQHGTRVVKRREKGRYIQVEGETGVTAWISPDPL